MRRWKFGTFSLGSETSWYPGTPSLGRGCSPVAGSVLWEAEAPALWEPGASALWEAEA